MSPRTRGSLRLRLEAFERLGAVRRFAADCLFAPVRRFVAVRCLAVVRRFAAVRRFNGARFFRDERDAAASFLRFAISCLLSETSTLSKKIFPQRGSYKVRGGHQMRVTGTHFAVSAEQLGPPARSADYDGSPHPCEG